MSHQNSKQHKVSRRTVLRGVGVAMGLPWLESLDSAPKAIASSTTENADVTKRFAVFFMGNGISPNNWSAQGSGDSLQLSKTLSVLEPFKSKTNVIDGLFNKSAFGLGVHPPMTGNLLSGVPISKGSIVHGGISMDQMIANHVGTDTAQASIVLSCEQPMTGYHETNYSNSYGSHISWQNADSPVPNEIYPSLAFDSLFENRGSLRNLSVLDRVKERAQQLSHEISTADKAKLDEYFTSVREVERQIERLRVDKSKAQSKAENKGVPLFSMSRPDNGLPEDLRDHTRLMCDIIAMAFQTDRTRVASLLLARDLSSLYYPFLDVRDAHHSASHHDTSEGYEKIVSFHLSQVAYLAGKLSQMPEGESTVLDNSCLMFISNMFSGSKHDNSKVPVVTVGSLGGSMQTGRALNYADAGDDNRKLCSLYLGIMDNMGVKLDHFGDADSRLAGF